MRFLTKSTKCISGLTIGLEYDIPRFSSFISYFGVEGKFGEREEVFFILWLHFQN